VATFVSLKGSDLKVSECAKYFIYILNAFIYTYICLLNSFFIINITFIYDYLLDVHALAKVSVYDALG